MGVARFGVAVFVKTDGFRTATVPLSPFVGEGGWLEILEIYVSAEGAFDGDPSHAAP